MVCRAKLAWERSVQPANRKSREVYVTLLRNYQFSNKWKLVVNCQYWGIWTEMSDTPVALKRKILSFCIRVRLVTDVKYQRQHLTLNSKLLRKNKLYYAWNNLSQSYFPADKQLASQNKKITHTKMKDFGRCFLNN